MPEYAKLLTQVGITASFVAAGFAFNASALTIPLVIDLPAAQATAFFKPFFYRGAGLVVPNSTLATIAFGTAAYLLHRADTPVAMKVCGYSPITLLSVGAVSGLMGLPFTRLVMGTVIDRLLVLAEDKAASTAASGEVVELLKQWSFLNYVRSGFMVLSGMLGFVALDGQL